MTTTRYIQRHSLLKRVIHGIVAVSTLALIATGAIVFVPALSAAVGPEVVKAIRIGHRVFAALFIGGPLLGLIVAPKGAGHIAKNLFASWDEDDRRWMALFPRYMFAPSSTKMPKQRETKSGQRLADGALIFASILIAVTGIVLLAADFVSAGVFAAALLLHDIAFVLLTVVLLAHMYLGAGIFRPYRGLHRLMFGDGRVSEADACYHWGHWAEEELKHGKNVVVVKE